MTNDEIYYCLACGSGFGAYRLRKLRKIFGEVSTLYQASEAQLSAIDFVRDRDIKAFLKMKEHERELLGQFERMQKEPLHFMTMENADFPKRFENIEDAPIALFYKGELPKDEKPTVAIIGSRECTSYGRELAYHFGELFARHNVQVISGMALGADAAGQWGALDYGGKSYAVLGCGIDICYPRENISLYVKLERSGGILSEYPPGTSGRPGFFPMRNRIISALSDCIIVVEAREKSGTMITVDHALNQGKEVFALPGRFGDVLSAGCNRLIKQGANLLMDDEEILEFFGIGIEQKQETTAIFSEAEQRVLAVLNSNQKHIDEIVFETGMDLVSLLPVLLKLEFEKWITQPMKNYYMKQF